MRGEKMTVGSSGLVMDRRWGISGSTLKLIAIVAMLIDHIGATVLWTYIMKPGNYTEGLYNLYTVMRLYIGRMAFPIFCFLLVEGFQRTSNVWKYALRLGIFALVSEIPFDLAFERSLWNFAWQNVFFTLFFGLLSMILKQMVESSKLHKVIQVMLGLAAVVFCMGLAHLLHTDYGAYGVMCMVALYLGRRNRLVQVMAGCAAFWIGDYLLGKNGSELWAPLGLLFVLLYNGRRGLNLKYVFYLFYPVHLLILYFITVNL